jgi:MoxR-like ATPase
MALVRKPVDLNTPREVDLCGRNYVRSPLTREEIERAGFKSISLPHIKMGEKWHQAVARIMKIKKALMVVGEAGGGKDVIGETFANHINYPLYSLSIKPELDINEYVSSTSLEGDGIGGTESRVKEGLLSKAVKGVKFVRGGKEYIQPCFILVSDIDRANPRQIEVLRQALQSDGNAYLTCPVTGQPIPVHPHTMWYFTSNSGVDGDGGAGNVTQDMDASIANRMVACHVPPPSESFERGIIMSKFGEVLSKDQVKLLVGCVRAMKKSLKENHTGLEVSVRSSQAVASYVISEMPYGISFEDALRQAFEDLFSGFFMEPDNRALIQGAIDPKIGSTWVDQQSV